MFALSELILHSFLGQIRQSDKFCGFFVLLYISWSFARPQAKITIVTFRLLSIETSISGVSWIFFLLIGNVSNTDYQVL